MSKRRKATTNVNGNVVDVETVNLDELEEELDEETEETKEGLTTKISNFFKKHGWKFAVGAAAIAGGTIAYFAGKADGEVTMTNLLPENDPEEEDEEEYEEEDTYEEE